jgi:uncharacterized protein with HEPN domain
MAHDETVYLRHILDAITRIEEYLRDVGEETFYEQYLIQDGVIRQLEIIGEAVRHVSEALRQEYPNIPWQDIAGTRDKLIHDYFGVDLEKVWLMVCEDIPVLKAQVQKILRELGDH